METRCLRAACSNFVDPEDYGLCDRCTELLAEKLLGPLSGKLDALALKVDCLSLARSSSPALHSHIASAITKALRMMPASVKRIRFNVRPDSDDKMAIFLRIVLSDNSAKYALKEATAAVKGFFDQELQVPMEMGVFCYFDFRSASECAKSPEREWA